MLKWTGDTLSPNVQRQIKGEVILKLTDKTAIDERIPFGPLSRSTHKITTSIGIGSLDRTLSKLNVYAITRVHPELSTTPLPKSDFSTKQGENSVERAIQERLRKLVSGMERTYRVRFQSTEYLESTIDSLKQIESMAEVSHNYFRSTTEANQVLSFPNDPQYDNEWGLKRIRCPEAWMITKGRRTVTVAVVDTGVNQNHPDLAANLSPGWDCVDLQDVSPPLGWQWDGDYLSQDTDPQDEVGHGTHVAGTIAAVGNNNKGVVGVACECKFMPVRVLARMINSSETIATGWGSASDISAGIKYAADYGAQIINLSLGGYEETFVEADAVDYANLKGCVVVASMGNDDTSTPFYPAAYPGVIAVGAIDENGKRISKGPHDWGSNMGSHISLVAPGLNILSTVCNGEYFKASGTSMAAPHVSGVAALLKSYNINLTNTQIKKILIETATAKLSRVLSRAQSAPFFSSLLLVTLIFYLPTKKGEIESSCFQVV